jgi:predicted phosphodiesterase
MTKHDLIQKVKELAIELGRTPVYIEFTNMHKSAEYNMKKAYGPKSYTKLLEDAGLTKNQLLPQKKISLLHKDEQKLIREYTKICSKREQIQGFFKNTLDLAELFTRAGNPPVLKVSAQPDTHTKFRDIPAVNSYLKFLNYYQPDVHIIMGDFVDCEGLSHWPQQDLEPRRIVPEMKEARQLLQQLVTATEKCSTRIFITGNHENWIDQSLARMPELFEGLEDLGLEINLKKLLNLEKLGYEVFSLNELVQIGHAYFTHGIYTSGTHSKKHLDVFKTNIFYGHMHDTQSFNQTSVAGPMDAQSLGCLCRLDAKFLKGRPNNWSHAHGIFEFFPDGTFTYIVPKIINGKMSYNGIVFDGTTKD